jgi:hypothetical protein
MIKQHIRNKAKEILQEATQDAHSLYYSSLLDQLVVLYISLAAMGFLLLAHQSIWPIIILAAYIIIAYLFAAYRNFSFAITHNKIFIVNARKPFVQLQQFYLKDLQRVQIGTNQHPILDRLFIIPSNVYVQIFFQNSKSEVYYTNIDFENDAKQGEKTLENFAEHLKKVGIECIIGTHNEDNF